MIVDSQVHVWPASSATSPHEARPPHRLTNHTAAMLAIEMGEAGVDRAVVLAPPWDPDEREARSAVAAAPERFRRVPRVRLDDPIAGSAMVAAWARDPHVVAARAAFIGERAPLLGDGRTDWLWESAQRAGLPLMCFAPGGLAELDRIATRFPDLRLIVDHLGLSADQRGRSLDPVIRELIVLGRHPRVAVKASALPDFVLEPYPFPSLHEPLRQVIDAFGSERVFWGSDRSRLPCTYRESVDLFRHAMSLSTLERTQILGLGALKWLGWTEATPAGHGTVGYSEVHQS